MIRVAGEPWGKMVEHAQATYPNECVSAMLGRVDGVEKEVTVAMPLPNSSPGSQALRQSS